MNESTNIPDNGCRWLHDASIDTEAWLQSIGEEVEWIVTPCFDNPESARAPTSFRSSGSRRMIGFAATRICVTRSSSCRPRPP